MQTMKFFKFLVLVVLIAGLASCGKKNTQGRYVPKEAGFVIQMDGKSLSAKLPWDEIKENPFFKEAYGDSTLPPTVKTLMENPENSGIDVKNDVIIFAIKDSIGGYLAFEGTVKDEAKFKAFNKQATENGTESEKNGVQFISKSPVCIGWTKDKFVYLVDAPQMAQMDQLSKRMTRDSISLDHTSSRDIGAACKAIFDLAESNSLGKNEKFSTLMGEKGDIRFWMNAEELSKANGAMGTLAMLNLDKLYKGNITTGTLNFEDGKMKVDTRSYASEELMNLFKKYGGGKVNEDMLKHMPGKDVIAVMALNFKPEGIRELIKLTGMDGLVNMGVSSLGFSMDDFIKANKGDIMVGFSDFSIKTDTATNNLNGEEPYPGRQTPDFNFIFSTTIGDKDAFNKLVNAGKKMGGSMSPDPDKPFLSYNLNSNYFALSNKKENVDIFLGSATTNLDFVSKITGEPFGGYLNIQSLLKSFSGMATKDSIGKIVYDASLKMWDNVLWKGGSFSKDGITQSMEINLVDKSTNSLKQINQYAAKLGSLYSEEKKRKKREMMADEIYPPVIDTTVSVKTK